MSRFVDGVLLIHYDPLVNDAPTIKQHVESFQKYSRNKVWKINSALSLPKGIWKLQFKVIVFHYSLFGRYPFLISNEIIDYVRSSDKSLKIAYFQDEYQYCQERFQLINVLGLDVIYSLLEEKYFDEVYFQNTTVRRVYNVLTGYVGNELLSKAKEYSIAWNDRTIDVSYRARILPFWMGKGAQEKTDIANNFMIFAKGLDLQLDIDLGEKSRFSGDDWYIFLANSKFSLGVEAGTSVFDLHGTVKALVERKLTENPRMTFKEISTNYLNDLDGQINYRMISPRIFESMAFGVVPILFSGFYNGVIKADENYIELNKDFSNFNNVVAKMRNSALISRIRENNFRMLSNSQNISYKNFLKEFDNDLDFLTDTRNIFIDFEGQRVDKILNKKSFKDKLTILKSHLRKTVNSIRS